MVQRSNSLASEENMKNVKCTWYDKYVHTETNAIMDS